MNLEPDEKNVDHDPWAKVDGLCVDIDHRIARLLPRLRRGDEAIDLLKAVIEDGKVNDVLWNQIQAALKKWGES